MILTGTFNFSHIKMVVVNRKDVYTKTCVGKRNVILWHKEHCPKVYKPEDIKEMLQGYLKSPFHRVDPSETTINVYHKTKEEMEKEKEAKKANVQLGIRHTWGPECMQTHRDRPLGVIVATGTGGGGHSIQPGSLVSIRPR